MHFTSAAVIRIANADPADRKRLLESNGNYKAIIAKAKELMDKSTIDEEQNKKLDILIGECSLPETKQRFGDAVELI